MHINAPAAAGLIVILLATATAGGANGQSLPDVARVRTTSPKVADLLAEGMERSATFGELLVQLEATRWFVFVEPGPCPGHRLDGCLLHTVSRYRGDRALRVYIDEGRVPTRARQIGTIAHELQHAHEVALADDVVDSATLQTYFARIGTRTSVSTWSTVYETEAAERVGRRVLAELKLNTNSRPAAASRARHTTVFDGTTPDRPTAGACGLPACGPARFIERASRKKP